jgi:hypothetical protein
MMRGDGGTPDFLAHGGTMGARMRAFDWNANALGPPASWPQDLQTAVRLLLSSRHPMFVWWGPQLIQFYNDAYVPSIGLERHQQALGQPGRECWAEIWDIIGPQIDWVMQGRGSTWNENHLVPITRNGEREDVYWTYSYNPLNDRDAPHGMGGVLVICVETTELVLTERRSVAAQGYVDLLDRVYASPSWLAGPLDHGDLAVRLEARFLDFVDAAQAMLAQRAVEGGLRNVIPAQRGVRLHTVAGQ